ncbi:MAG TPA: S8 family peptidase [Pirellulales bacterium]|nr:S8 family peptidase [Pirellulales bacterium]
MPTVSPSHQFEHLPLVLRDRGPTRVPSAPVPENTTTADNKTNRATHSAGLGSHSSNVSTAWKATQQTRLQDGLPSTEAGIPLLLKIDTSLDLDELRRQFDFEIVSEQEDGFVIVASEDIDLTDFQTKLTAFATATGSANVAKIHDLKEDLTQQDRLARILTETLLGEWPTMQDAALYVCDVSVACVGTWEVPTKPKRNPRWKAETWARKENDWSNKRIEAYDKWDNLKDERLRIIRSIIDYYHADILQNVDNADAATLTLPDSFTLRLKISAKGLRDLVLNYPYIFEVAEPDDIETPQHIARQLKTLQAAVQIQPPPQGAPTVCVIDSGIQEEHILLEPGIDKPTSHCFLPGKQPTDIADYVTGGGHGTRVAGAVLHGEVVAKNGVLQMDAWVQNARVLNDQCEMATEMMPPAVIRQVVKQYHEGVRKTRIFNHSINSRAACRTRHMSAWAAEIDLLSNDYDVLVIQSAGNIRFSEPPPLTGVSEHLAAGRTYPAYLNEASSRVANPAQSLQALTVGSVAYRALESSGWRTLASEEGQPSGFSRSGLGIWDSIKPEVVEYGGDCLITQANPPDVSTPDVGATAYPELVRSTLQGGPAYDRDVVGTSFAAPKVTKIAARLQAVLPDESCLLYRALIAQSAQWPDWSQQLTKPQKTELLRRIGYGIPNIDRATRNTDYRVTFVAHKDRNIGEGECHIYQVPIPAQMRGPADEYDIRIDVTLSYAAPPRRTRRSPRGYLATWLDWTNNRKGESLEAFLTRALKKEENVTQEGEGQLGWVIHEKPMWGLPGVKRSVGTIQKDWAIVKSNALPEDLCIAVRGHQGWSQDPDSVATYTLAVTFEIVGKEIPIYEPLRAAVLALKSEVEAEMEAEIEMRLEDEE